MKRVLFHIMVFISLGFARAQVCPQLIGPFDNDEDVAVTTEIRWENLTGQHIFLISLGTTPGGTNIIDKKTSGTFANFTPPKGLPERTRIYISLTVIDEDLTRFDCEIGSFVTEDVVIPPSCTTLRDPLNNAIFVREEVNIVWNYAPLATGYRITIGTSPEGNDIVEEFDVGNTLFYDPPNNLPLNSEVYVKIVPYNENGPPAFVCDEESFAIRTVSNSLQCTNLRYPTDGAIEIPKSVALEWNPVNGASGYKVSLSISPFPIDVFYTAYIEDTKTNLLELESTHKYYVTIVPYNDAGEAVGCANESFTTIVDCGPFTDDLTGETVILNPITTLQDQISLCNTQLPKVLSAPDRADGYRWYQINSDGTTDLISETEVIELFEPGNYLYEIYDTAVLFERTIECSSNSEFSVVIDEGPRITRALAIEKFDYLEITVEVEGNNTYEYSLESAEGPFQNSNRFENMPPGSYIAFVRSKDGCGVSQRPVQQNIAVDDFPKFFTPNGDGINDFWQFKADSAAKRKQVGPISIFDRYGVFILQIATDSNGWDGTINGRPLPASEYWFEVFIDGERDFNGHFSLKR